MRPACRWTRSCLRWGCAHGLPAPGLAGGVSPLPTCAAALGNRTKAGCICRKAKKSPPCAKGGQHGNAMQGGLQSRGNDSAGFLLSGTGAPLGCGGSPSIPQSAFADSSLCTREPSLPFCIEPAQRGTLVRCPDGHTFFAFLRTTGPARERSMGAAARRQRGSAVWVQRHAAYMYSKKASRALFT